MRGGDWVCEEVQVLDTDKGGGCWLQVQKAGIADLPDMAETVLGFAGVLRSPLRREPALGGKRVAFKRFEHLAGLVQKCGALFG